MKVHADIQTMLYDYMAGDLASAECRKVEEHLAVCPACTREFEDLKSFSEIFRAKRRVPSDQLSQEYWVDFASDIERRISDIKKKPARSTERWWEHVIAFVRFRPRFAAAIGSSMAIIAVAVSLLVITQKNETELAADDIPALVTHPVNVDERVGQYLKKSKVLLVGLSNMETGETSTEDLSAERAVSRQLVNEARYLQQQSIDFQASRLIRDLAKMQEDLAVVPETNEYAALRIIRQNIHRDNLLFKVRMAESVYGDARFVSTAGKKGLK